MGHPGESEATMTRVRLNGTRTPGGNSSWRAAHLLQTDAEYMAAADQLPKAHKTLATQEPTIQGLRSGLYGLEGSEKAPVGAVEKAPCL